MAENVTLEFLGAQMERMLARQETLQEDMRVLTAIVLRHENTLIDVLQQTSVLTAGQKAKLENARTNEYATQFALRLMWKDFGNVMRLAQELQVPIPATAAAHQISTIEQRRGVEEDFSAVIRTMEQLAGLPPAQLQPRQDQRAG